jgi:hypothetical protein
VPRAVSSAKPSRVGDERSSADAARAALEAGNAGSRRARAAADDSHSAKGLEFHRFVADSRKDCSLTKTASEHDGLEEERRWPTWR